MRLIPCVLLGHRFKPFSSLTYKSLVSGYGEGAFRYLSKVLSICRCGARRIDIIPGALEGDK